MQSNIIFDSINYNDEEGNEYWYARDLQKVFDYKEWRKFHTTIKRAIIGCETIGVSINNNFVQVDKIVKMGVAKRNNGKPIITIIYKRFTLDGNYEFYGVEKNFYDDKRNVKREIIKQLAKNKGLNM